MERVPSRWILQIASALAGERWWSNDLWSAERDWITHVASFDAGIRRMAFAATAQEHRLRSLMVHGSTRLSVPVLAAAGDGALGAGATVVAARRSDRFTRFDGNLAGVDVAVAGGPGHLRHQVGEMGVVPVRLPHAQRPAGR